MGTTTGTGEPSFVARLNFQCLIASKAFSSKPYPSIFTGCNCAASPEVAMSTSKIDVPLTLACRAGSV